MKLFPYFVLLLIIISGFENLKRMRKSFILFITFFIWSPLNRNLIYDLIIDRKRLIMLNSVRRVHYLSYWFLFNHFCISFLLLNFKKVFDLWFFLYLKYHFNFFIVFPKFAAIIFIFTSLTFTKIRAPHPWLKAFTILFKASWLFTITTFEMSFFWIWDS